SAAPTEPPVRPIARCYARSHGMLDLSRGGCDEAGLRQFRRRCINRLTASAAGWTRSCSAAKAGMAENALYRAPAPGRAAQPAIVRVDGRLSPAACVQVGVSCYG